MAVRPPAGGFKVDFHIAGARGLAAELNDRAVEIRAALAVQKTGMKNSQAASVQRGELFAEQALVSPDRLQQDFRRRRFVFAQLRNQRTLCAPAGIKIL